MPSKADELIGNATADVIGGQVCQEPIESFNDTADDTFVKNRLSEGFSHFFWLTPGIYFGLTNLGQPSPAVPAGNINEFIPGFFSPASLYNANGIWSYFICKIS